MYIFFIYTFVHIHVYRIYVYHVYVCMCVHVCVSVVCKYIPFGRYERSPRYCNKKLKKTEKNIRGPLPVIIKCLVKATGAATGTERPRSISHSGLFSVRVVTCPAPSRRDCFLKSGHSVCTFCNPKWLIAGHAHPFLLSLHPEKTVPSGLRKNNTSRINS